MRDLDVRPGSGADEGVLLSLFDEAVAWLVERGQEGQWGSEPFSQRPDMRQRTHALATGGGLWVAEQFAAEPRPSRWCAGTRARASAASRRSTSAAGAARS